MDALHAVEASGVGRWMRESLWAFPIVETVHISGFALLVGSIVVVDLRLAGLARAIPITRLAAFVLPWTVLGFLVALPSGLLMFTAHPGDYLGNPVFMLKMGLILAAGANAAWLHTGPLAAAASFDVDAPSPPLVRTAALVSIACWIGVIACGRLLAYT
jgi:hypothetical protein